MSSSEESRLSVTNFFVYVGANSESTEMWATIVDLVMSLSIVKKNGEMHILFSNMCLISPRYFCVMGCKNLTLILLIRIESCRYIASFNEVHNKVEATLLMKLTRSTLASVYHAGVFFSCYILSLSPKVY